MGPRGVDRLRWVRVTSMCFFSLSRAKARDPDPERSEGPLEGPAGTAFHNPHPADRSGGPSLRSGSNVKITKAQLTSAPLARNYLQSINCHKGVKLAPHHSVFVGRATLGGRQAWRAPWNC